jgi:hypothetical protein
VLKKEKHVAVLGSSRTATTGEKVGKRTERWQSRWLQVDLHHNGLTQVMQDANHKVIIARMIAVKMRCDVYKVLGLGADAAVLSTPDTN